MSKPTISVYLITRQSGKPFSLNDNSVFSYNDPDGNPAKQYNFYDGNSSSDSGYFVYDGVKKKQGDTFGVWARDLNKVQFVPGSADTTDRIGVYAIDSRDEHSGWSYGYWNANSYDYSVKNITKAVKEGNTLSFKITRSGDLAQSSVVYVSTSDGDAKAKSGDYEKLDYKKITFPKNESSVYVDVKALPDKLTEPEEMFYLNVYKKSTDAVPVANGYGKIADDPSANYTYKIVNVNTAYSTAYLEGQKIPITIERTGGDAKAESTIYLSTGGWTGSKSDAQPGVDYVAKNFEKIVFPAGKTSRPVTTPTIEILKDKIKESTENFDVILYSQKNNTSIDNRLDISKYFIDDEANYTYSIRSPDAVKEGEKTTFVITRSGSISSDSTVYLSTKSGIARSGEDFAPLENIPIQFKAGDTTANISVTLYSDSVANEGVEDFQLLLSDKAGASSLAQAVGKIQDATLLIDGKPLVIKSAQITGMGINTNYKTSDFLSKLGVSDVPNKFDFGPKFYGHEQSLYGNYSNNFGIFDAKISAGTQPTDAFKIGLEARAGYDLGSLNLTGGITGNISYDSSKGIQLKGISIASPQANLQLPYLYGQLDFIGNLHFNPQLSLEANIPLAGVKTKQFDIPSINFDNTTTLLKFDNRTPEVNLVNQYLKDVIKLPDFGSSMPRKIATPVISTQEWNSAFNNGIAPVTYGYTGSVDILNLTTSLTKVLELFKIQATPISVSQEFSLFGVGEKLSASLVDLSATLKSNFNWNFSASLKSNMWYQLEGSANKYELKSGDSPWIDTKSYADINKDNKLDVTIFINPMINLHGEAKIINNLGFSIDSLKGNAEIFGFNQSAKIDIGPIVRSGDIQLGKLGDISLLNFDKTFDLASVVVGLNNPSPDNIFAHTTSIALA